MVYYAGTYDLTVRLEETTSVSNEDIVRKNLKGKKTETKMEAEMRKKNLKAVKAVTTMTMTTKGMKMRWRVEKRQPHIYNPDFCHVVVQPRRCVLVPPGQRPTNLTPYCPKRMGVLKF